MVASTRKAEFKAGAKYHLFQIAGLGEAPYTLIGVTKNVYSAAPGHSQPGGSCDYCGTGIIWEFWLRSADGRQFKVGSDCIFKHDSDKALRVAVETEVQKRQREMREARRMAQWQKDAERVNAAKERLAEVADDFRAQPHPRAVENSFFSDKTLLDWAEWMLANAGMSGRLSVAAKIEKTLSQKG